MNISRPLLVIHIMFRSGIYCIKITLTKSIPKFREVKQINELLDQPIRQDD